MTEATKPNETEQQDTRMSALAKAVVDEQQKRAAEIAAADLPNMSNSAFRDYCRKHGITSAV